MTSYRARCTRFLLKHSLGRKYRKAGSSIEELRRLDDFLIRSQAPPRGTHVSTVALNGFCGEWILGPGAGSDATILHLHGGAFVSGSPATAMMSAVLAASIVPVRPATSNSSLSIR